MTRLQIGFIFLKFILVCLILSTHLRAQATEDSRPLLIMLSLSESIETRQLERRVTTQLKLELDELDVSLTDVSSIRFREMTLAKKLEYISSITKNKNVTATCWIEASGTDAVMLHMVALRTGRAFIRVVTTEQGPRFAEELAFSAQELLGQIYMMAPLKERAPVKKIVSKVIDDAQVLSGHSGVQLSMAPFFEASGANPMSWFQTGGGLWLEVRVRRSFFFSVSALAALLPLVDPADGRISGAAFVPELQVGYTWWTGKVGFGVGGGVQVGYYRLKMVVSDAGETESDFWDAQLILGTDIRFSLSPRVSVVLIPAMGIRPHTRDFKRMSDHSVIVATSYINWRVRVGLQFVF